MPANATSLLFGDVLDVKQARIDHIAFVDARHELGVDVVQHMLTGNLPRK
ncbi:hypothetical protein [Cypionkella sp.]|nr:hypothetical protein [Cypionkella sp.]MDZ4392284.1 hypothetical protein [Cypionkella sp.]